MSTFTAPVTNQLRCKRHYSLCTSDVARSASVRLWCVVADSRADAMPLRPDARLAKAPAYSIACAAYNFKSPVRRAFRSTLPSGSRSGSGGRRVRSTRARSLLYELPLQPAVIGSLEARSRTHTAADSINKASTSSSCRTTVPDTAECHVFLF